MGDLTAQLRREAVFTLAFGNTSWHETGMLTF